MSKVFKTPHFRKSEGLVETGLEQKRYMFERLSRLQENNKQEKMILTDQILQVEVDLDLRNNLDLFYKTKFFVCKRHPEINNSPVVVITLPDNLPEHVVGEKFFLVEDSAHMQIVAWNLKDPISIDGHHDTCQRLVYCMKRFFIHN